MSKSKTKYAIARMMVLIYIISFCCLWRSSFLVVTHTSERYLSRCYYFSSLSYKSEISLWFNLWPSLTESRWRKFGDSSFFNGLEARMSILPSSLPSMVLMAFKRVFREIPESPISWEDLTEVRVGAKVTWCVGFGLTLGKTTDELRSFTVLTRGLWL